MTHHIPLQIYWDKVSKNVEGKEAKNAVVLHRKMNKIGKKESGCIIFTHQEFHDSDSLIEIYNLERWCQINTEDARNLLFRDGTLE